MGGLFDSCVLGVALGNVESCALGKVKGGVEGDTKDCGLRYLPGLAKSFPLVGKVQGDTKGCVLRVVKGEVSGNVEG